MLGSPRSGRRSWSRPKRPRTWPPRRTSRLDSLARFDRSLWERAQEPVAGVDEAGRGPLAGPVVAAAVVFDPKGCGALAGLDDSKRLPPGERERLIEIIRGCAQGVGLGIVSPGRIDEINILEATMEAMQEAVSKLGVLPGQVWVDGDRIPSFACPAYPLVDGDQKSLAIAAASVVAKVTRDRLMTEADRIYPGYGFAKHKGYGTREHLLAIQRLGPCPIHRKSFAPLRLLELPL